MDHAETLCNNSLNDAMNGSVTPGRARLLKIILGVFSCALLLSTSLSAITHNESGLNVPGHGLQLALAPAEQSSSSRRQLQQVYLPSLLTPAGTTPPDRKKKTREQVQQEYEKHIAGGFIQESFGMLFLPRVMRYFTDVLVPEGGEASDVTILDAGCGQCKVVEYLRGQGFDAYGVEVSSAALKEPSCLPLMEDKRVQQGWLTEIPHPDDSFDFVFSSDVLEHIPTEDIPQVVKELVRVSKGHIFLSIALTLSRLDPRPPAKPTVHVTVKPREWWDKQFAAAGCKKNRQAMASFLAGRKANPPNFFSYKCKDAKDTPIKQIQTDSRWKTATLRELWRTKVQW